MTVKKEKVYFMPPVMTPEEVDAMFLSNEECNRIVSGEPYRLMADGVVAMVAHDEGADITDGATDDEK